MSDLHSTDHRGPKAIKRPVSADESDADKALSFSDHHRNQTTLIRHDARYWQGACPLISIDHCRLGVLEGRVVSWRGSLEEFSSSSKSSAVALRRHESVTMLPHLFSNLAVTRTHSEPCISEKDFLKITLPLPGELNCEANVSFVKHPEGISFQKFPSCDSEPLIGLETQQGSSAGSKVTSFNSAKQGCDEAMTMTDLSSRSPGLWDRDESTDDNAGPVPDIIEVSNMQISSRNLQKSGDDFLGAESSTLELEQDWNVCCAASGQVVASRKTHWDDWWSYQLEDFSVARGEPEQHRNVSKGEGCTSATGDDNDEDASEEGYMVLDEQEEKQLASFSKKEVYHETGDKGIFVNHVDHDCVNEESPIDWNSGSQNGYQEDDIWSDEHFVSSQVKGFPPPISILANETHPGLPSHVPKTLWRSVKRNGRFVLQEVQARPREFFQATREYGRLRLQLVRPDSESTGSYTETASMEDKEGSLASRDSAGNFVRIAEVCHEEDVEIETPAGAGPISTAVAASKEMHPFQIEDEESRGETCEDKDCAKSSRGLTLLPVLSDQFGGTLQQEHSGADIDQRVGRRTSADRFGKDFSDQGDSDVVDGGSRVADHNGTIEEIAGERVRGKGFGCMRGDIMAQELNELDVSNQASGMPHGRQEHYRQDYHHPRYSATYGFDSNLSVLSPTQALMQLPIQSAVR